MKEMFAPRDTKKGSKALSDTFPIEFVDTNADYDLHNTPIACLDSETATHLPYQVFSRCYYRILLVPDCTGTCVSTKHLPTTPGSP